MEEHKKMMLRNFVYEVFELDDYNKFFRYFNNDEYAKCVKLAEIYLAPARESFFATLSKDVCDILKAHAFHSAYRIYEMSMESMAMNIEVNNPIEETGL